MYEIELYCTESGRYPVLDFLKKLTKQGKTRDVAQIKSYGKRLEEHGMAVNNIYPKTIRNMGEDIYELRPGGNRVFFFYFEDNKFVLLHAYEKHGQKAPRNEIEKAINEMKDYKRRKGNEKSTDT